MAKPKAVRAEPEELLLEYAERLTHHRAGRRAVFIGLSELTPTGRPEDRYRLVEGLFAPLVRHHGGEIFKLRTGDVVAVLGSADQALGERVTHKLFYLFRDDPFVERASRKGAETFVRWFDLSKDYDAFFALARQVKDVTEARPKGTRRLSPVRTSERALPAPLSSSADERQGALIRFLYDKPEGSRALARLCHALTVMRLRKREPPLAAFEWLKPRAEIASLIGFPQGDIERNPALGEALANAVLRRLLVELPEGRPSNQAVILNAHLEGLLGQFFLVFHKAWSSRPWHPVTFLLQVEEQRGDPERFRYACKFLHGLGHRVGVCGLTLKDVADYGLAALDLDLAVVPFDSSLLSDAEGAALTRLFAKHLTPEDTERVLLDGVDTPGALAWGLELGISLFSGKQAQARLASSHAHA